MKNVFSGMTGFGRSDGAHESWTWSVEARSVNGRALEVRFRGPPGFDNLERQARSATQSRLSRGSVAIAVHAKRASGAGELRINQTVLDRYLNLANALAEEGATPPSADGLLGLRGVVDLGEDDEDTATLEAVAGGILLSIEQALDALKSSRASEGAALQPVILQFVEQISSLVMSAETESRAQVEAIQNRFARRMAELAPDIPGLDERIVLEAAALATRADVREELDRLSAHVAAARNLVQQPPAGRKLDFLMQEFMREANTLCSKSATSALTGIGLELKAVIEQLREQVQNVE